MTVASGRDEALESVESFVGRARTWVQGNLPLLADDSVSDRELQARLFDAEFAGIAMPRAVGGAGLTLAHQQAFFDEAAAGYRVPSAFSVSIAINGATLLDEASEVLKLRHLPRILRGDERWIQLLSEPSGGSDMASATSRLTADGAVYHLDGAKMWSSGALTADWGLCLARTDATVPKHRGLSMICVPLQGTPGLTIQSIRHASGEIAEFCQEFFDDVVLPAEFLVGAENDGWSVARTLMKHERLAAAGTGHGYGLSRRSAGGGGAPSAQPDALIEVAKRRPRSPGLATLVADAYIERAVARAANERIMAGIRSGALDGAWGSLLKLHLGSNSPRESKIALGVHGADGVVWDGDATVAGNAGEDWVVSRGPALGGGTNEMQRNLLSEQILGLPREPSFDRDVPFDQLQRSER